MSKRELFFKLYRKNIVDNDAAIFHFRKKRKKEFAKSYVPRAEGHEWEGQRAKGLWHVDVLQRLRVFGMLCVLIIGFEINIDCRCVIIELI